MTTTDVLYPPGQRPTEQDGSQPSHEPAFFRDLNLGQVIADVTANQADYSLTGLYWCQLRDLHTLRYRQEIFRDLDRANICDLVRTFAQRRLVFQFRYRTKEIREDDHGQQHYYRTRFFLNAVAEYCQAVLQLADGLEFCEPRSRGLGDLAGYLHEYVSSAGFLALHDETLRLEAALDGVHYIVVIRGDRITVAGDDDEADYGKQVAATFARFQRQPRSSARAQPRLWEAYAGTGILDLVAQLYPDVFAALDAFCGEHADYLDPVIARFDGDIQFYLSYLDYIAPLRAAGLAFSYPRLSDTDKSEQALDTFDLALAQKLRLLPNRVPAPAHESADVASSAAHQTEARHEIVVNDITVTGAERILVISGPNNGGKTTLARTFGQLHYLARLGCPVPGRETRLFVCDQILTHFNRTEDSTTMTGKLQTELNRLRDDFAAATPASVIILNEMFNSTTAADALFMSREILQQVSALDALCVCVTFLDELATLNDKTVSMVSTVVPDDPATRTHKVVRQPADGRAYARAIADKYGLGFDRLVEELSR
ncbi:DNA mismatch repair protein MutS [Humibacillus sp. DSM 29435]|uniref:MutS-related protein n=1 Tax=Humibacillus sp. DSM 29435 TaxID=1869167 RepID=UPI0011130716|nr:DNA mismatch repair protein MutS [Humibacillus sp. DSM 29435]